MGRALIQHAVQPSKLRIKRWYLLRDQGQISPVLLERMLKKHDSGPEMIIVRKNEGQMIVGAVKVTAPNNVALTTIGKNFSA